MILLHLHLIKTKPEQNFSHWFPQHPPGQYIYPLAQNFQGLELKEILFYRKDGPLETGLLFKTREEKKSSIYVEGVFTKTIKPSIVFSPIQKMYFLP